MPRKSKRDQKVSDDTANPYSKQYNSRRGQRYYAYLISKKDGLTTSGLRNDMYLVNHEKLEINSFNKNARQMKSYDAVEKFNHFTIERTMIEKSDDYQVHLHNHSYSQVFVDHELIGKDEKCELRSLKRIAIENEDNQLCLFVDTRPDQDYINDDFIKKSFRIKDTIGTGYSGVVNYAFSMDRKDICALKRVNKEKFSHYEGLDCTDELDMLKSLKHPNVIQLFSFYDTDKYLYLELEYAAGGNLFDRLYDNDYGKALNEFQAKCIIFQMLKAVEYMHKNGVTHRDIKPENMLLMSKEYIPLMKLSDFGTSHQKRPEKLDKKRPENQMTMSHCTVEHAAPEIIKIKMSAEEVDEEESYTSAVDLWSTGVVSYETLTARQPFEEDENVPNSIENKILDVALNFSGDEWKYVSPYPKEFIKKVMKFEPKERLTAKEALEDEWFSNDEELVKEYSRLTSSWKKSQQIKEHNL